MARTIVGLSLDDFLANGCNCNLGLNNGSCLESFPREEFIECRDKFLELTNEEKDMLVMSYFTINRMPNKPVDKKMIPGYKIYGYKVCKRSFLYLMNISSNKYQNIADHYNRNGFTARRHGNKGRLPSNTSSFETTEHVRTFIQSYARDNFMPLTGRVHGLGEETHLVILSSVTKKQIWELYSNVCHKASSFFFFMFKEVL